MAEATIQWREGVVVGMYLLRYGVRPSLVEGIKNEWFVSIKNPKLDIATEIKMGSVRETLLVYERLKLTLGD